MSEVQELIHRAKEIRQRLRYPPNPVVDKGINLGRKLIPPKEDMAQAIERFMERTRSLISCKVTITSLPPVDFEAPLTKVRFWVIRSAVCRHFRIKPDLILSKTRTADVVRPRQVICYLARCHTDLSMPEIGRKLGGKDHTTVLHSDRKIAKLIQEDTALADDIRTIEYDIFSRIKDLKDSLGRSAVASEPKLDLAQESASQAGGLPRPEICSVEARSWLDGQVSKADAYQGPLWCARHADAT